MCAQCDLCGKWRGISAEVASELDDSADASWQCSFIGEGRTCKTSALDWGAAVRKVAQQQELKFRQEWLAAEVQTQRPLDYCTETWLQPNKSICLVVLT